MSESILVFTHRNVEFLTKLNASTSWQLNQNRAMLCDYVICVRNTNSPLAEKDFTHGSAFLVGKISNVVQSLNLQSKFQCLNRDFVLQEMNLLNTRIH